MAHPQNYLEKKLKNDRTVFLRFFYFLFFEFFHVILGVGHFGSCLVIFEYFRVWGIWVSLTGALNRKSKQERDHVAHTTQHAQRLEYESKAPTEIVPQELRTAKSGWFCQDKFDHDKGQKSAISGHRVHWTLSTGFLAFSPAFMCNLVRRASPLKSGESSEKSSGENRVKSCHVCGCRDCFGPDFDQGVAILELSFFFWKGCVFKCSSWRAVCVACAVLFGLFAVFGDFNAIWPPFYSGVGPANQTKERAKTKSSWISPIFVDSGVFP